MLGRELPDTEWDTVGGLVFNLLGHVPEAGETVRFQGLEFRTERVDGRRITSVAIMPVDEPDDEPTPIDDPSRRRDRMTRSDAARDDGVPVRVRHRWSAGRTSGSRRS